MKPLAFEAVVFLLPAPVAGAMWLAAFHPVFAWTETAVLTVALALAAMGASVLAFARELGPAYEGEGSRVGLLLVIVAVLAYMTGTSAGNDVVYLLSIATFYLGSVLYLGGVRSLLCALPSGLVLVSLSMPEAYGVWGTIYLDGLSWVLVFASVAYLLVRRNAPRPAGCGLCNYFQLLGMAFCSSCGRMIGRVDFPVPRRRMLGFAAFSAIMLVTLSLTVPLVYTSPTVSLVSFGLGGSQANKLFAPLPGWEAVAIPPRNGSAISGFALSQGKVAIQAYVATSQTSYGAFTIVNSAKRNATPYSGLPASIANSMEGYTLKVGHTEYIGILGVFPVGRPGGSVTTTYLAVDLRQTLASFQTDRGSALFGAASSVIGWSSSWDIWSPVMGQLLWAYQTFSQAAYICSFSAFGVILFTVARDDERTKARRNESIVGLNDSEAEVLSVFLAGPQTVTGEELHEAVRKTDPRVTASEFYESLDELSRRGLVSPTVVLRGGTPRLHWKRAI